MASITVRNIDDDLKEKLRVKAAQNGRSMEEEVRVILRQATGGITGKELWELSRKLFADDGIDLELPPRQPGRPVPDFSGPEYDPPRRGRRKA